MATSAINDRLRLRRILDLSDRLERLRRRTRDQGASPPASDLAEEIREIAGRIVTIGLPGALGRVEAAHDLSPQEQMILLLLLNHRVETGDCALSGREILATIFPSSFGILTGGALLERGAPLRASEAVEPAGPEAEDPLDTLFTITDRLYRAVEREVRPRSEGERSPSPYRDHWEHLADLGRLASLMLRRANALFEIDPFGSRAYAEPESTTRLLRRVENLAASIRERLSATAASSRFPLLKLAEHLKLDGDEQTILVGLLVQECFYGSPGLEAVDCVKMVSRSPEELLRKRVLLAPDGKLCREALIEIDEQVDDRELTGEVLLPRWVASLLLGEREPADKNPIGPDTRLEFHEYLKGLGDSDQFFRDLGT